MKNWFSSRQRKDDQVDVTTILSSLQSNGIQLSIDELVQYQSKSSLIKGVKSKRPSGSQSGNYLARSKGRGMEFDEVRQYQTGDDIRTIDWRVTARTGKTYTKLFREEIERPVLIATDFSAPMQFGSALLFKSVQAAHLAALLTWQAHSKGDRIGGMVFNEQTHIELKPRSRKTAVLHYLHALIEMQQQSLLSLNQQVIENNTTQLEQNCARLRQIVKPGALVYLITDGSCISEESIRHLSRINKHCELVICTISDPLETTLPQTNRLTNVAITNGQSMQQLTIGDKKTEQIYHQKATEFYAEHYAMLQKTGARMLHFSAGKSLEQQLTDGVASWIR